MARIVDLRRGDPLPTLQADVLDPEVVDGARSIIERVRAEGDAALVEMTRRYDGADIEGRIRVDDAEVARAT
ncbi:MAG TPA: hypothetical protein VM638_08550, partial [Actinomycetota bacterium]|nr:hypothetical protein [Actinomycetota bacterium]